MTIEIETRRRTHVVALTSSDLGEIDRAAAITIHGARYPEELEKHTGL